METDLSTVIRGNILADVHKVYIIYQLLKAIRFMHSGEVVHRDIKPSNILLDNTCTIKVADFGLARSLSNRNNEEGGKHLVLTDYVAARWYRAPEILLGSKVYTKEVDMWSVGCILGELALSKTFFPGNSTMNQLDRILEVTGLPTETELKYLDMPLAGTLLNYLPKVERKRPLEEIFPEMSKDGIDLLSKLLKFNPRERLSAEESLHHPYVSSFYRPEEIRLLDPGSIVIPLEDQNDLTVEKYREYLYNLIENDEKWREPINPGLVQTQTTTTEETPSPRETESENTVKSQRKEKKKSEKRKKKDKESNPSN